MVDGAATGVKPAIDCPADVTGDKMAAGFLQRERIVAPPNCSRWLVPPAALSIHLAIGQAYAWSVFKPPLERGLDISGVASALPFTLGIIMLGLSAALFGTRVDANGHVGRCSCRRPVSSAAS
jgi:hypothetical protein